MLSKNLVSKALAPALERGGVKVIEGDIRDAAPEEVTSQGFQHLGIGGVSGMHKQVAPLANV